MRKFTSYALHTPVTPNTFLMRNGDIITRASEIHYRDQVHCKDPKFRCQRQAVHLSICLNANAEEISGKRHPNVVYFYLLVFNSRSIISNSSDGGVQFREGSEE